MYVTRTYCRAKDKGYLNDYEKRETQVLVIPASDTRNIPFRAYDVCRLTNIDYDDLTTIYMCPANMESANTWDITDDIRTATYNLYSSAGSAVITGTTTLNEYNVFYVPITNVSKGNYELKVAVTVRGNTYTKTIPVIFT